MRKISFGGGVKSRASTSQIKPVAAPVVPPGLVSFQSFRVKKSTSRSSGLQRSSSSLAEVHPEETVENTQRYSGSSLGSAGSSYASSGSSSDNRSSIGTDDGFLTTPACVHPQVNGKDIENGVVYNRASQHVHILKSSSSVESFGAVSNSSSFHYQSASSLLPHHTPELPEMPQDFYAKPSGINTSSRNNGTANGVGNGHSESVTQVPHHVTVHIDPHTVTANVHLPPYRVNGSITGAPNAAGHVASTPHSTVPNGTVNSSHVTHHPHVSFVNTTACMPNHFQTQISLEDPGIDMTQSPGRESPSSTASSNAGSGTGSAVGSVGSGSNGCRHSTSSFDSGRASSTIYQHTGVRYSGLSSESSGSFRHSYHSSSSSLGSIAPEDICNFDVAAMIAQGVPDHEVLNAWLTGIHFENYYQNFVQAGYDMQTISRMTPEDLNAIGVTKPHHRKRLKAEISQLNITDGLPDFIPSSVDEWLALLKLEEYTAKLKTQGYHSVRQVTNITWEDLEDFGVLKLGHQKKFMLAIKRIEDILAGKRIPGPNAYVTPVTEPMSRVNRQASNGSIQSNGSMMNYNNSSAAYAQYGASRYNHGQPPHSWRLNGQNGNHAVYAHLPSHTLVHQPQLHNQSSSSPSSGATTPYQADVVSIQLKNNGRRNSMENVSSQEPIYGTSSFQPSQRIGGSLMLPNGRGGSSNSVKFEEGDVTPTNECIPMTVHPGMKTCTLPRSLKHKSMANKYMYSGIHGNHAGFHPQSQSSSGLQQSAGLVQQQVGDGFKSLPRDIGRLSKAGMHMYIRGELAGANNTIGKTNSFKNGPPPPPRRGSCSATEVQPIYSSTNGHGLTSCNDANISFSRPAMPPPPPTLSCDQFDCASPADLNEEFPAPPEELLTPKAGTPHQPQPPMKSAMSHPSPAQNQAKLPISGPSHYSTGKLGESRQPSRNATIAQAHHPLKAREQVANNCETQDGDFVHGVNGPRGVRRNGSDASFKSNSSTESESIPFANDNAGTIKQQKSGNRLQQSNLSTVVQGASNGINRPEGSGDVLNDIGNMLADLTDELDAILEQEKTSKR